MRPILFLNLLSRLKNLLKRIKGQIQISASLILQMRFFLKNILHQLLEKMKLLLKKRIANGEDFGNTSQTRNFFQWAKGIGPTLHGHKPNYFKKLKLISFQSSTCSFSFWRVSIRCSIWSSPAMSTISFFSCSEMETPRRSSSSPLGVRWM